MSALAIAEDWGGELEPDLVITKSPQECQLIGIKNNYCNILGPAYVDKKVYIERCKDAETLFLELGERAAFCLIIDSAMFKSELELYQTDGWW